MTERRKSRERKRIRERKEKVRARERSPWRERVYRERESVQGDAGLRVRRGGRRRGFALHKCYKRWVRDPRSSQDARRTQTRA